jgi:ferric-dicitrate binding protein FerR (iron transport regulator)
LITKRTIRLFFEGKCDAGDVARVQAWLKENPDKLSEYFGVEEWEEFQPAQVLPPDVSGRLWGNVNKNTITHTRHFLRWKWMAVAASVLLVVIFSWQLASKKQTNAFVSPPPTAKEEDVLNNSPQTMRLALSDGSTVDLSPNSRLSYPGSFRSSRREVTLNGEAKFNIAKNDAKPFYVHSNAVLISVLGTRFTVNSFEGDNATKVILHEGKVMVKIPDSASRDHRSEFYLAPGDIFVFKKPGRRPYRVKSAPDVTPVEVQDDSLTARIMPLEKDKADCYVFNNYPLDVVFDQLQIIYNTRIIYNKDELGNRSFIGKIDKNDSFYHILQSIALLNNFRLQRRGDSCIISN